MTFNEMIKCLLERIECTRYEGFGPMRIDNIEYEAMSCGQRAIQAQNLLKAIDIARELIKDNKP